MANLLATYAPTKLEPFIHPEDARTLAVPVLPSLTVARGTLLGLVTSAGATQGKAGVYASANADGTQIPLGPAVYDFVSDASGNVVIGGTGSTYDLTRGSMLTTEVYWKGTFLESELTGLDANAISVLKARELGVSTNRMLHIP